jgi:hypothetical protein
MLKIIRFIKTVNEYAPASIVALLILCVIFYFIYQYLQKTNLNDQKKSIVLTFYSFFSLIVLLFLLRFWPPNNYTEELIAQGGGGGGMAINFGDTDMGKGSDYQNEDLNIAQENQNQTNTSAEQEEIITQDNIGEAISTPLKNPNKPKVNKPIDPKPVVSNQQPVKKTNSVLERMKSGKNKGGDGNSTTNGNQGSKNGSAISDGYYGDGKGGNGKGGGKGNGDGPGDGDGNGPGKGSGRGGVGGANFSLAGRRAIQIPDTDNTCNQFGKVVINVTVDKSGKTVAATNGKGTNADACLINLAKQYAMRTKWSALDSAADKQTGTITYNFKN